MKKLPKKNIMYILQQKKSKEVDFFKHIFNNLLTFEFIYDKINAYVAKF